MLLNTHVISGGPYNASKPNTLPNANTQTISIQSMYVYMYMYIALLGILLYLECNSIPDYELCYICNTYMYSLQKYNFRNCFCGYLVALPSQRLIFFTYMYLHVYMYIATLI